MRQIIAATTLLLAASHCLAEAESTFPGVEGLMKAEEYQAAGLEKLSDEERAALNQWLIRYTAWEAPAQRQSSKEVRAAEEAFEIVSRIKQPFTGWSGKTVFYLENGQVWQQRNRGSYSYRGEDSGMSINKNFMGMHVLRLTSTGREIGVKRLK